MSNEILDIIDRFFNHAELAGLELLDGDKKLLGTLCVGLHEELLVEVLREYLSVWQKTLKWGAKQAVGRRRANEYLRQKIFSAEIF